MKKILIVIIAVVMLTAVFAGCANDRNNNNVTPTVIPTTTRTPAVTQPAATLSPTDVLPSATADVVPSPVVSPTITDQNQ